MIAADIVYVLFILLRFNTSYVNSKSVEVLEPRACRRAYLATAFALDAIALIPLNYAALAAGATPLMVAAFRMLRLIYVRYPVREYVRWSRALADDDLFNGMLAVLGWLFVTLHVLTCVYQAIGPDLKARMYGPVVGQLLDSPALTGGMAWLTWDDIYMARRLEINGGSLSDFASPERTVAENYVVSLFAIVQLLTTMGSNQLPANMLELGFYCFVLLLNLTVGLQPRVCAASPGQRRQMPRGRSRGQNTRCPLLALVCSRRRFFSPAPSLPTLTRAHSPRFLMRVSSIPLPPTVSRSTRGSSANSRLS
jgi:hypothetical protein